MHPLTAALAVSDPQLRGEIRSALTACPVRVVLEQPAVDSLQLKRLNLDLLLVDANPAGETIDELVRRARMLAPGCMITVISRQPDPNQILAAMHAGAHEFVLPPYQERLRAAVERICSLIAQREISSRQPAKTLAFVSAKGGCGATSVACHAAASLRESTDDDILLADLDFFSGLIGFLIKTNTSYTMLDALQNVHRLDASLWKGYVGSWKARLDVMPTALMTAQQEQIRPDNLRQVFRLIRSLYGWVIADLGRGLNPFSIELLQDIDDLCLVTTPTLTSLYQAKQFSQRVADRGFPRARLRIILNQVPEKGEIDRDEIQELLRAPIYAEIGQRSGLDQAYAQGTLLNLNSKLGAEFAAVAMKLAGLPAQAEVSRGWQSLFGRKRAAIAVSGD